MRLLLVLLVPFLYSSQVSAQGCCSGGSGSPIAGGTSQGVLVEKQAEVNMNFQYINSNKFMEGDRPAKNFLDNFNTKYVYTRFAYGVTNKLTLSLESGYFLNKTQIGVDKNDTITSSGIGDLIIFPRYKVYEHNTENTRNEITVGMGYKMPLGKYYDSSVVYRDNITGRNFYSPKPPAVLATTGSNDFIFYGFAYKGIPAKKLRFFTTLLYMHTGWNQLGQKFGDYAGLSLFAGKTVYDKLGITLQLKGEYIGKMKSDPKVDMVALYNLYTESTGLRRVIFSPQLSYAYKSFSFFALSDFPIYQYVNGTGIAAQNLITVGFNYRFLTVKPQEEE
jgi:hypothetical protein